MNFHENPMEFDMFYVDFLIFDMFLILRGSSAGPSRGTFARDLRAGPSRETTCIIDPFFLIRAQNLFLPVFEF